MGIFDFITDSTKELVIARPESARGQLVYKHPDKTIPKGAQLTVFADEIALFFSDGQYIDQLGPGRHTLEGQSIPFLGRLLDHFTDGNLWMAQIYFVTTRQFLDLKFGGRLGQVEDPESRLLIRLGIHGTYSLRVADPSRLLIGAIGTGKDGQDVNGWLREIIMDQLSTFAGQEIQHRRVPLLDLTSGAHKNDIKEACITGIKERFNAVGVDFLGFGNFDISMREDDRALLQEKRAAMAEFHMAGDKARAYAQFQKTMGLAEGLRTGKAAGALAGAGIGAGFGMAQMMAREFAPPYRGGGFGAPGYPAAPGYEPPQPPLVPAAALVACPSCSAQVAPGKFCSSCGTQLAAPGAAGKRFCTNCGEELGGKFCGNCGTPAP